MQFFSYLIEQDICYLVLCERNYSKRLAFSYLEEIAQEFYQQYGKRVCLHLYFYLLAVGRIYVNSEILVYLYYLLLLSPR